MICLNLKINDALKGYIFSRKLNPGLENTVMEAAKPGWSPLHLKKSERVTDLLKVWNLLLHFQHYPLLGPLQAKQMPKLSVSQNQMDRVRAVIPLGAT